MTMNRQHWWPNFFMSDNTIWLPRSPLPILKLRPHKYAGIIVFTINYKGEETGCLTVYTVKKVFWRGGRLIPEVFYVLCTPCPWKQQGFKGSTSLFFSNPTHPRNFCIKRRQGLCFRALAGKKVEYIQLICLTFGERVTVMRACSCTGRTFDWWAKTTSRHCETLCLKRRSDRY